MSRQCTICHIKTQTTYIGNGNFVKSFSMSRIRRPLPMNGADSSPNLDTREHTVHFVVQKYTVIQKIILHFRNNSNKSGPMSVFFCTWISISSSFALTFSRNVIKIWNQLGLPGIRELGPGHSGCTKQRRLWTVFGTDFCRRFFGCIFYARLFIREFISALLLV